MEYDSGAIAETTFVKRKAAYPSRARIHSQAGFLNQIHGELIAGYEIHQGQTTSPSPLIEIVERGDAAAQVPDGAVSEDGRVLGGYLHGLFDNDNFRNAN